MKLFDYELDLNAREIRLLGGPQQTISLPPDIFPPELTSNVERITVLATSGHALLRLPGDIDATVELAVGRAPHERVAGRRIVYLDQNMWSTIAKWRNGNSRISAPDAAAAERLIELVESEEILLPVSGAHVVETTPLFDERRVELAGTVLSGSRGWQMKNPLRVRTEELRRGIAGDQSPAAQDVFALNGEELFGADSPHADFSDLPHPFGVITAELLSAHALYDTVIDRAAIARDMSPAAEWAADWARVARLVRTDGLSSERIRGVAHTRLIVDVGPELATIARELDVDLSATWKPLLEESDPIGSMPCVSRTRGVLTERMLDPNQRWEANHLIDIVFLCCAAGYADVVIGERQTIAYLRRVRNVPTGAALATTLSEGVALLEEP